MHPPPPPVGTWLGDQSWHQGTGGRTIFLRLALAAASPPGAGSEGSGGAANRAAEPSRISRIA